MKASRSVSKFSVVVIVLCLANAGAAASDQKVVLDEPHAMHTGNESAPPYNVPAADALVFDTSGIDITAPEGTGPANAIHVRIAAAGYYRVPLAEGSLHRIDGKVAQPLRGSQPLTGFKPGEVVAFAIVHDNFDTMNDGDLQFEVIWAGMIRVR